MMQAVKNSLEDADLALLLLDIKDNWEENDQLFQSLASDSIGPWSADWVSGMPCGQVRRARSTASLHTR